MIAFAIVTLSPPPLPPSSLLPSLLLSYSAKQLVRGEPNVSYICSRYYRAPELIFGATDYTSSIGSSPLVAAPTLGTRVPPVRLASRPHY